MIDNPVSCVTTKLIRAALNKDPRPVFCVCVRDEYFLYYCQLFSILILTLIVDSRWPSFNNWCIKWRIYIMEWINI